MQHSGNDALVNASCMDAKQPVSGMDGMKCKHTFFGPLNAVSLTFKELIPNS